MWWGVINSFEGLGGKMFWRWAAKKKLVVGWQRILRLLWQIILGCLAEKKIFEGCVANFFRGWDGKFLGRWVAAFWGVGSNMFWGVGGTNFWGEVVNIFWLGTKTFLGVS